VSAVGLKDRNNAVGWTVALVALLSLGLFGAEGDARWPWLAFNLVAAVPLVLLLVPDCQVWARARVAAHPSLAIHVPFAFALYGMTATLSVGSHNWRNLVLWPLCVGVATAAAGRRTEAEVSPGRLLVTALGLAVLAGVWERGLQIQVPGGLHLSLAFLVAIDLALFLLVVSRPLRTFDVRLGLTVRELGHALGAVAVLAAVAIPLGFALGFLSFQSRWLGLVHAVARMFGLILFVGLPEEMLFRGTLQEAFTRLWTPRAGLAVGALGFGLSHLLKHAPHLNWPYGLLATLAGLVYGWVYQKTGKLGAAAVTHGAVDWIWSMFLGA
jgi:membrane protease YdiL (CAAX protease family)